MNIAMNARSPLTVLKEILPDGLGEDWDLLDDPEQELLGVPRGTIERLLREIDDAGMWPALEAAVAERSEQWMLDLTCFFPKDQSFVVHLVEFLSRATSDHAMACLAQESDTWGWGAVNCHLLPAAIERVRNIQDRIKKGDFAPAASGLNQVIENLTQKLAMFGDS